MITLTHRKPSQAEAAQIRDTIKQGDKADASAVYAALKLTAVGWSLDRPYTQAELEHHVNEGDAREALRHLDKELPACPSAPTPATPSPSPSPKTQASRKHSSDA